MEYVDHAFDSHVWRGKEKNENHSPPQAFCSDSIADENNGWDEMRNEHEWECKRAFACECDESFDYKRVEDIANYFMNNFHPVLLHCKNF